MLSNFPARVPGVDNYHGGAAESFYLAAVDGIRSVIIKATQGSTEVDPAHSDSLQRVATLC
jgi:GH25 family lysozyme M1 (1,4-beta-N-acetylmuramidase)